MKIEIDTERGLNEVERNILKIVLGLTQGLKIGKIAAIKTIRQRTGLGLREAKALVDEIIE